MNNKDIDSISSDYEIFMRRAFRLSDLPLPDYYYSAVMKDFIEMEQNGKFILKTPDDLEKYRKIIKSNLEKAIAEYLKLDCITSENLEKLAYLKHKIDPARSTFNLMDIIEDGLELTESVKLHINKIESDQAQRMLNNIK